MVESKKVSGARPDSAECGLGQETRSGVGVAFAEAHRMPRRGAELAQDVRSGPRLTHYASVTVQHTLPEQTCSERPAVRFAATYAHADGEAMLT